MEEEGADWLVYVTDAGQVRGGWLGVVHHGGDGSVVGVEQYGGGDSGDSGVVGGGVVAIARRLLGGVSMTALAQATHLT